MNNKNLKISALVIALILITSAFLLRAYQRGDNIVTYQTAGLTIGQAGSEHSHISTLVFVNGQLIDFSAPEFQLQSLSVHFEDRDGIYIHKHATGITLPFFFKTLNMKLNANCITTREGTEHCNNQDDKLSIFINRKKFEGDLSKYELRKGDKILIDYGHEADLELMLKVNSIPDLDQGL